MRMPGTVVAIGWYGPRISAGRVGLQVPGVEVARPAAQQDEDARLLAAARVPGHRRGRPPRPGMPRFTRPRPLAWSRWRRARRMARSWDFPLRQVGGRWVGDVRIPDPFSRVMRNIRTLGRPVGPVRTQRWPSGLVLLAMLLIPNRDQHLRRAFAVGGTAAIDEGLDVAGWGRHAVRRRWRVTDQQGLPFTERRGVGSPRCQDLFDLARGGIGDVLGRGRARPAGLAAPAAADTGSGRRPAPWPRRPASRR